jgi:phosphoribosyl-AMP cyclohydrolase
MLEVKYDEKGLIPAIIQDIASGEVLMMAYMNEEALRKTIETGYTHFYSRSRQKLWKKGETSGHVQEVKEVLIDCDKDTLLIKVIQHGPGACHTGHRSCFFRNLEGREVSKKVFSEEEVYGSRDNQ